MYKIYLFKVKKHRFRGHPWFVAIYTIEPGRFVKTIVRQTSVAF